MGGAASQAAANQTLGDARPAQAPGGTQECPHGRIRLGVFFDGTGNNMYRDWGRTSDARMKGLREVEKDKDGNLPDDVNGPSNVAKLYQLFKENGDIQKKIYVIGVGAGTTTVTSGTVADEDDLKPGENYSTTQMSTGKSGRERIDNAIAALTAWVNTPNFQLATEKRIDVFGFSRGAAEARDFVNKVRSADIDDTAQWNHKDYKYEYSSVGFDIAPIPNKVPAYEPTKGIIFEFLGIFDTVGSFGLGALYAVGNSIADYDFSINGRPAKPLKPREVIDGKSIVDMQQWVHRTFHAIAEDEYRAQFPLELAGLDPCYKRDYKPLPKFIRERSYPGAHSDVGGGYRATPGVKGTPDFTAESFEGPVTIPGTPDVPAKHPNLCNIPLRDMIAEAKLAFVPMGDQSSLPADVGGIPGDLDSAYSDYLGKRMDLFGKFASSLNRHSDYWPDDIIYIHTLPRRMYSPLQDARLGDATFKTKILEPYIHDSSEAFKWQALNAVSRLVYLIGQPTKTFTIQRGVHFHGPQVSYDDQAGG